MRSQGAFQSELALTQNHLIMSESKINDCTIAGLTQDA